MRCGHLFNGISGFGLAAAWMGWENVMHCEIDSFCNRVMKHHFPNSFQHEDIRTTDFRIWRGKIDLITGGFPCQPYSTAGKRKGKEDDRHLWPEMFRAIREISPRWIVAENVRGLVNWSGGLVFDEVQADMEAEGYEVIPFLLPACGVNAPHRRDRIWFVAYRADARVKVLRQPWENKICKPCTFADTTGSGHTGRETFTEGQQHDGGRKAWCKLESFSGIWNAANTSQNNGGVWQERNQQLAGLFPSAWENFPTQPPVRTGNDGLPSGLVDIAISKWIEESITAFGNAIVPQVAYEIFKAIEEYETMFNRPGREQIK